jgi:hypothetical protein
MPGHIIQTLCDCGFEKELYPGWDELKGEDRSIAFNSDKSDIDTLYKSQIVNEKLEMVRDPFLMNDEEDGFLEKLGSKRKTSKKDLEKARQIVMKNQRNFLTPEICPHCKNRSLFFHFLGHWD